MGWKTSLEFDPVKVSRECRLSFEAQIRDIAGSTFPANSKVSGCAVVVHLLHDASAGKTISNREVDPAVDW